MATLYKEVQKFSQWWLWLILLAVGAIPVVGIYQQIILENEFGDHSMTDERLLVSAGLTFLMIVLFAFIRLITVINKEEIRITFFPFVSKRIKWENIQQVTIVDYGFVGGWGIRWFTPYGTVYNTSGRMGLSITLKSGKQLLVGTQQPEELNKIITQMTAKK